MSISPKIVRPQLYGAREHPVPTICCQAASQGTLQAQGPRRLSWRDPAYTTSGICLSLASSYLGQAPGSHNDTHYLPHLANICCDLFIKIRGKLVLFPLERLFYMISLLPLDLPPLLRDGNCVEFKLALFLICWRKQRKPGESHALCWV